MRISYSAFDTYKNCPLKYKYQEIDKIKGPKSKEAVFGTLVHSTLNYIHTPSLLQPTLEQALDFFSRSWNSDVFEGNELEERSAFSQGIEIIQRYYKKNDPSQFNIVDLESRFQIEIGVDNDRHVISGIIDRIDKTENGYEIIDYKTTKKMPSQEKVDNDLQLSVYLKAFLSRYPKEIDRLENITVSLYYLKHGVKLSSTRTLQQLQESEKMFLDVIDLIKQEQFEPLVSGLCDWCAYQNICPMWRHKFKEQRKLDSQEVEQAIEEYVKAKADVNSVKHRVMELQEKISKYMDQEGVERVFSEQGIVVRSLKKTYGYDEKKLREILEPLDHWEDVIKIDGTALKSILGALPLSAKKEIELAKKIVRESQAFSIKKK